MLSEWDRRSLGAIERQLRQDDPDLARQLERPAATQQRRGVVGTSSTAAIGTYLVMLIACVLLQLGIAAIVF